jgi:hypothetical protein
VEGETSSVIDCQKGWGSILEERPVSFKPDLPANMDSQGGGGSLYRSPGVETFQKGISRPEEGKRVLLQGVLPDFLGENTVNE